MYDGLTRSEKVVVERVSVVVFDYDVVVSTQLNEIEEFWDVLVVEYGLSVIVFSKADCVESRKSASGYDLVYFGSEVRECCLLVEVENIEVAKGDRSNQVVGQGLQDGIFCVYCEARESRAFV